MRKQVSNWDVLNNTGDPGNYAAADPNETGTKLFLSVAFLKGHSAKKIQTQTFNINKKYLFFSITELSLRKIRSPEHFLKLERWQGPPHINKDRSLSTQENELSLCI